MKFTNIIDVIDIYDKKITTQIEIIKLYAAIRGISSRYKT